MRELNRSPSQSNIQKIDQKKRESLRIIGIGLIGMTGVTRATEGKLSSEIEPESYCQSRQISQGVTGTEPNCFVRGGFSGPSETTLIIEFDKSVSSGQVYIQNGPSGTTDCPITNSGDADWVSSPDGSSSVSIVIHQPDYELSVTIDIDNVSYIVKVEECT